MGRINDRITDYKNFWLIWMNCAGKPGSGESLFQIQNNWGIKTNYLYHNEAGLGKPLYVCMINDGYLRKSGRKLLPTFDWIPQHVKDNYASRAGTAWFPSAFIGTRWPVIQTFIEKNASILFSRFNLRVLYKNSKDILGSYGSHIFTDIFLYVLFANFIPFTKKLHADIVMRILSTFISLFSDRDLLNYIRQVHPKIGNVVPLIISNEREVNRLMYPYKW
jgi:hypothetical protein